MSDTAEMISRLEEERNSRILVLFLGDRAPFATQLSDEVEMPLVQHLSGMVFGKKKRTVELLLYGTGGKYPTAGRIACLLREFCDEFNILIPHRCRHASTLLAAGADRLIMNKTAELTAVRPLLDEEKGTGYIPMCAPEAAEDLAALLNLYEKQEPIRDPAVMESIFQRFDPLDLGRLVRQRSCIQRTLRKLLMLRKERNSEEQLYPLYTALTDPQNLSIGREEAKDIGLPVSFPKPELENSIEEIYSSCSSFLDLEDPVYPARYLDDEDEKVIRDMPLALLESSGTRTVYEADVAFRRRRDVPQSPDIDLNLNVRLPLESVERKIPRVTKPRLDRLRGHIGRSIETLVMNEIVRQSPAIGVDIQLLGGRWRRD